MAPEYAMIARGVVYGVVNSQILKQGYGPIYKKISDRTAEQLKERLKTEAFITLAELRKIEKNN